MNSYKYQRSRSFTDNFDLDASFSIFNFFTSKTAELIETKVHVEPNESLCVGSESHYQDGSHAHMW